MNCTNITTRDFYGNYTYHVYNISTNYDFILYSLMEMINHQFKRHYLYAESFMLESMKKQKHTFSSKEIELFVQHMHTPLIYAYTIFIGFLISIIIIPYIFCFGSCTRKSLDATKYHTCFAIEGFLLLLGICLSSIGISGGWQMATQIQVYLQDFPPLTKYIFKDLQRHVHNFKSDVMFIYGNVTDSINCITNVLISHHKHLISYVERNQRPNKTYESLLAYSKLINKSLGFVKNGQLVTHVLTIETDKMAVLMRYIRDNVTDLENMTCFNKDNNCELIRNITTDIRNDALLFGSLQYPDWSHVYNNFSSLLSYLHGNLKEYNIHFVNFKSDIEKCSKRYFAKDLSYLQSLQMQIDSTMYEVMEMTNKFIPNEIVDTITNATLKFDHVFEKFSLSKSYKKHVYYHINVWLLLFPVLHALAVIVMLFFGYFCSAKELKKISNRALWMRIDVGHMCSLKLFKIALEVSMCFMWLILLFAEFFFLLHLPMSVVCYPFKDGSIFFKYFDNRHAWKNHTWIEYNMQQVLVNKTQYSARMEDLYKSCRINKTIFDYYLKENADMDIRYILNFTEMNSNYPNINNKIKMVVFDADINTNVVNKVDYNIFMTDEALNSSFIFHLLTEIELFKKHKFSDRIIDLMNILPKNQSIFYNHNDLRRLTDLIKFTCNDTVWHISDYIKNIVDLEYFLHDLQKEIIVRKRIFQAWAANKALKKVHTFVDDTYSKLLTLENRTIDYVFYNIKYKVGNCYILSLIYDYFASTVCVHGLSLITGYWISLIVIATSMTVCIILSCRIAGYIRGTKNRYLSWNEQIGLRGYN